MELGQVADGLAPNQVGPASNRAPQQSLLLLKLPSLLAQRFGLPSQPVLLCLQLSPLSLVVVCVLRGRHPHGRGVWRPRQLWWLYHSVVIDINPRLRLVAPILFTCNGGVGGWRVSNRAGGGAVVAARLAREKFQAGSFPHQQLQLPTRLEVEDCVAKLDVSEAGAVALDDLVAGSQPHFSGKSSRLRRLDEDAGLLDGALEVDNP